MNDLRLYLETVERELDLRTRLEQYRSEKYESLLQPWVTKSQAPQQSQHSTEKEPPLDTEDAKLQKEIENVDNLLEKAKLIRETGGENSKRTTSAPTQPSKQECRLCMRGTCSRHKKPNPKAQRTSAKIIENTKNQVAKKPKSAQASSQRQTVSSAGRTRPNKSAEQKNAQAKTPPCPNGDSAESGDKSGPQPAKLLLDATPESMVVTKDLTEVVEESNSLKKFLKLKMMHAKLKTETQSVTNAVCNEEQVFISALYGGKENVNLITSKTASLEINTISQKAHNLKAILSAKDMLSKSHDTGVKLYLERKLYRQVGSAFDVLSHQLEDIRNAEVVLLRHSYYTATTSKRHTFPSPFYLEFKQEAEVVALCKAESDLAWNSLLLAVKSQIYGVLMPVIHRLEPYVDSEKTSVNKDFSACIKHAFGLLAQKQTRSVLPALVWDK